MSELDIKAIFISIGYSSCHWCHVMEERPDIDKHYQEVHHQIKIAGNKGF